MLKRGEQGSGGNSGLYFCDTDHYLVNDTTNSFTNGQTVGFNSNTMIVFNCQPYDYVVESKAVSMSVYGMKDGAIKSIGSAGTSPKSVTDYDFLLYMRGGSPATSFGVTFS